MTTADWINNLPDYQRDYIHALETNCDPSGIVQSNAFLRKTVTALENRLSEEKEIVDRIWSMFGNPAYPFLDGKSIFDLVQDGLDAIQLLVRYREGHRQPSGQECYVNIEQGDYRCADCIEADRLTGVERHLREISAARMERLRASLAQPNNGL